MSITLRTSDVVESLIKRRLFKHKEQAYENGVLLIDLLSKDPKLKGLREIDEKLLYARVKKALHSIKNDKKDAISNDLLRLADVMKLRHLLGPLFHDSDSEIYDTLSDTLRKYAEVLSHYEIYDEKQKKYIISDLKRDLSALMEYVDKIRQENQKHDIYYKTHGEYVHNVTQENQKLRRIFNYEPRIRHYKWVLASDERFGSSIISSDPYLKKPIEQIVETYVTITK